MRKILTLLVVLCATGLSFADDLPKWLEDWKFKGDFRIRYDGTEFDDDAVKSRNRGRYRLRLAATKKLGEKIAFELRLASGGQATTTNQTLDDSFEGKEFYVDRAFLTYKSRGWTVGAGKFANPFHHTDMVWDSDVNQEGLFQSFKNDTFFMNFGEMIVEEESVLPDTNLLAFQFGLHGNDRWKVSAAYYSYLTDSNSYSFVDVVGTFLFPIGSVPSSLNLDYAKNVENDYVVGPLEDEDTAWAVYLQLGRGDKPRSWVVQFKYAEIEAQSVAPQFTDSDFGFADKEGISVSGTYVINKHFSWSASAWSTDSILAVDEGFNRFYLDLVAKF